MHSFGTCSFLITTPNLKSWREKKNQFLLINYTITLKVILFPDISVKSGNAVKKFKENNWLVSRLKKF